MNRRHFLGLVAAASLCVGTAEAASLQENFGAQLRAQGFRNLQFSRTWLGRARITAQSKTHNREIIYNPRTGEILRDFSSKIGAASTIVSDRLFDPDGGRSDNGSNDQSDAGSSSDSDSDSDNDSDSESNDGDGDDDD